MIPDDVMKQLKQLSHPALMIACKRSLADLIEAVRVLPPGGKLSNDLTVAVVTLTELVARIEEGSRAIDQLMVDALTRAATPSGPKN
jgi:hypothetical protein